MEFLDFKYKPEDIIEVSKPRQTISSVSWLIRRWWAMKVYQYRQISNSTFPFCRNLQSPSSRLTELARLAATEFPRLAGKNRDPDEILQTAMLSTTWIVLIRNMITGFRVAPGMTAIYWNIETIRIGQASSKTTYLLKSNTGKVEWVIKSGCQTGIEKEEVINAGGVSQPYHLF